MTAFALQRWPRVTLFLPVVHSEGISLAFVLNNLVKFLDLLCCQVLLVQLTDFSVQLKKALLI